MTNEVHEIERRIVQNEWAARAEAYREALAAGYAYAVIRTNHSEVRLVKSKAEALEIRRAQVGDRTVSDGELWGDAHGNKIEPVEDEIGYWGSGE